MAREKKEPFDRPTATVFNIKSRRFTIAGKLWLSCWLLLLALSVLSFISYSMVHDNSRVVDASGVAPTEDTGRPGKMGLYITIAIPLIAFVVAGGAARIISKNINQSVSAMANWAEKGGVDICGQVIEMQRNDELGDLANALNIMCQRRLQFESALQESERVLNEAQRIAVTGSWQINIAGGYQKLSPMMCDIYGFEKNIISMEEGFSRVHPDDRKGTEEAFASAVAGEASTLEYRIIRTDGEMRTVVTHGAVLIRDADGNPTELIGVTQDITERKHIEKALQESEEIYRSFMHDFSGILYRADLKSWTPVFFHGAVEEITGYKEEDFIKGDPSWDQVIHSDDLARIKHESADTLLTVPNYSTEREYRIIRQDGQMRWIHEFAQNICLEPGKPTIIQGIIYDITERKDAEMRALEHQAQLAHLSRLHTLKGMTSELAHQIGQPLCAILTNTHACLKLVQSGSGAADDLTDAMREIIDQVERANSVIGRIRDYARKQEPQQEKVDIHSIIRDSLELIGAEADRDGIPIQLELTGRVSHGDEPVFVMADSILIEQVIVNIARNAIESMAEEKAEDHRLVVRTTRAGDGMVEVSIADTGHGISTEAQEMIFDPFFTTKAKGLGIGLSLGRSIVESHSGRIWVEPNPGGGSIFRFTLPEA